MLQMLEEQDRSLHHLALQLLQESDAELQHTPAAAFMAAAAAATTATSSCCTASTEAASTQESAPRASQCPASTAPAAAAAAAAAGAAATDKRSSAVASSIADALIADVRSYELLQQVGGWPSADSQQGLGAMEQQGLADQHATSSLQLNLSIQDWRNVATTCQEAADQMRHSSLAQLAEQLRSQTMRLGYLLHACKGLAPGSTALPGRCLQQALEDYVRFVSLLHSVADTQCLQLCW
jgi:hypothetical protein